MKIVFVASLLLLIYMLYTEHIPNRNKRNVWESIQVFRVQTEPHQITIISGHLNNTLKHFEQFTFPRFTIEINKKGNENLKMIYSNSITLEVTESRTGNCVEFCLFLTLKQNQSETNLYLPCKLKKWLILSSFCNARLLWIW